MQIKKEVRNGVEVLIFPFKEFSEALIGLPIFKQLLTNVVLEVTKDITDRVEVCEKEDRTWYTGMPLVDQVYKNEEEAKQHFNF